MVMGLSKAGRKGTKERRRRWLRPILAGLLAATVALIGTEVALRLSGAFPVEVRHGPGTEMVPDSELLYVITPGILESDGVQAHINSLGLRGSEHEAGDGPLILFVGDSSIFGWGIEDSETLPSQLAGLLGGDASVMNAGIPGYSSEQSLVQLRALLPTLKPDLVIIANLWSDTTFNLMTDRARLARQVSLWYRAWHWMILNLDIRDFRLVRGARQFLGMPHPGPRRVGFGNVFQMGDVDVGEYRRVPLESYVSNLDTMATLVDEHGAGVVFLALPDPLHLRLGQSVLGDAALPWESFRQALLATARRHGCEALDAAESLLKSDIGIDDAFVDVIHPSAQSFALIAEDLAELLRSVGFPGKMPQCGEVASPSPPGALEDPCADPTTGELIEDRCRGGPPPPQ